MDDLDRGQAEHLIAKPRRGAFQVSQLLGRQQNADARLAPAGQQVQDMVGAERRELIDRHDRGRMRRPGAARRSPLALSRSWIASVPSWAASFPYTLELRLNTTTVRAVQHRAQVERRARAARRGARPDTARRATR